MSIPPRIGVIGLGVLGRAMALKLVNAGFSVSVHNRTRARTYEFAELGCEAASTPRALAKSCGIVLTTVSDRTALDAVLEGPEGVFSAFLGGNTLINMTTVPVSYAAELAQKCYTAGVKFADCQALGSKAMAESGELAIFAGGEPEIIDKLRPVLLTLGKTLVYAGPAPGATALKLCLALIAAHQAAAVAETDAMAKAFGIPAELIAEALRKNPEPCPGCFSAQKTGIFAPARTSDHMLKEIRSILVQAHDAKLELPVTEAVEKLLAKSYNSGHGTSPGRR